MRTRTGANMNTLEKYFQTSTSSSEYVRNYLSYLSELVLKLDRDEIVKVIFRRSSKWEYDLFYWKWRKCGNCISFC